MDGDGDIYVADWGNDRVQLFNPEGRYVEQFLGDANLSESARAYVMANPITLRLREMSRLEPARRFRGPISVRVDDQGRMLVPDFGSHRIQVYKKESYPLEERQLTPALETPTSLPPRRRDLSLRRTRNFAGESSSSNLPLVNLNPEAVALGHIQPALAVELEPRRGPRSTSRCETTPRGDRR